jgi:DNA (cytosine-5)-methyltransferase 1
VSIPAVKYSRSTALDLEPDGRAPTWDSWAGWAATQDRPLAVDLFAGGGGLSLGLEDAGYRVAFAADHDPWSVRTHAANFRGLAAELDLSDPAVESRVVGLLNQADIAVVAGGPPCQPFSRAGRSAIRYLVREGRRPAHDDRRELWQVWLRIVLAVRPEAVLLENVPDMALGDDVVVLRAIVDELQAAGYETHFDIVEAREYGVPQHRQRLILVALRDQDRSFVWPATDDHNTTIWDAIGDLPPLGEGTGDVVLPYRRRTRTPFQERARAGVEAVDRTVVYDHVTRAVRDDDRLAFRLMTSTTRYGDLPEELRRYRADTFNDKYKRHSKTELARSITAHIAKDGYWYIHPTEERTLTVREAARLQTFPDRYRFAGNRTHAFRQIGNAVPPLLAERIGRALLAATHSDGPASLPAPAATRPLPHHFPTATLKAARDRLDLWGERDATGAPWRHPTDPWTALVSTLLESSHADDGTIARALWHLPTPAAYDAEVVDDLGAGPGAARALRRLAPAADAWKASAVDGPGAAEPWWERVSLKPAEAERFAVLALGRAALLTTQAPLRLAARVTGRPVNRVDRLTDGRLALAELVGGGDRAAARMAALAALGREVCRAEEPDCVHCPLSDLCRSAL